MVGLRSPIARCSWSSATAPIQTWWTSAERCCRCSARITWRWANRWSKSWAVTSGCWNMPRRVGRVEPRQIFGMWEWVPFKTYEMPWGNKHTMKTNYFRALKVLTHSQIRLSWGYWNGDRDIYILCIIDISILSINQLSGGITGLNGKIMKHAGELDGWLWRGIGSDDWGHFTIATPQKTGIMWVKQS